MKWHPSHPELRSSGWSRIPEAAEDEGDGKILKGPNYSPPDLRQLAGK